jgi:surface polysaccharide O-acyltransferase-like enzyme
MENKTNFNFDLMKIIAMFFIVLGHIILLGNVYNNVASDALKVIFCIILFTITIHVNSFILVTGYFQSSKKFKINKVVALIFKCIFYSFTILLLLKYFHVIYVSKTMLISSLLPSICGSYWFIGSYIILYCLSNYLNILINHMNKKQFISLIMVCFLIFSVIPFFTADSILMNNGYNFYSFIFLYFVGAYLKQYPLRETFIFKKCSLNLYRLLLILIFFSMIFINYSFYNFSITNIDNGSILSAISGRLSMNFLSYSSPFLIIQSIAFFCYFETLTINNKTLGIISKGLLGVYLITVQRDLFPVMYKMLGIDNGLINNYNILFKVLFWAIIIFSVSLIIDLLRIFVIQLLQKLSFIKRIIKKWNCFINSFYIDSCK